MPRRQRRALIVHAHRPNPDRRTPRRCAQAWRHRSRSGSNLRQRGRTGESTRVSRQRERGSVRDLRVPRPENDALDAVDRGRADGRRRSARLEQLAGHRLPGDGRLRSGRGCARSAAQRRCRRCQTPERIARVLEPVELRRIGADRQRRLRQPADRSDSRGYHRSSAETRADTAGFARSQHRHPEQCIRYGEWRPEHGGLEWRTFTSSPPECPTSPWIVVQAATRCTRSAASRSFSSAILALTPLILKPVSATPT